MFKARLVARGFEEFGRNMETDTPTCSYETLKQCIAKILQEGWVVKSIDVWTAYTQGDEIKRVVHLKPPVEAKTKKL